jgi:hypothetical protein
MVLKASGIPFLSSSFGKKVGLSTWHAAQFTRFIEISVAGISTASADNIENKSLCDNEILYVRCITEYTSKIVQTDIRPRYIKVGYLDSEDISLVDPGGL